MLIDEGLPSGIAEWGECFVGAQQTHCAPDVTGLEFDGRTLGSLIVG
jgi:hypothetical protein